MPLLFCGLEGLIFKLFNFEKKKRWDTLVNSGSPERYAVHAPLVAPVVLL
jgi:hypothetical protein